MAEKASDYKKLAQDPEKFQKMFWIALQSVSGIPGLAGPMGPGFFQTSSEGYMAPAYLDYLENQDLLGAQQEAFGTDADTVSDRASTALIRLYKTVCGEDSLNDADIQTIQNFAQKYNKHIMMSIPILSRALELSPESSKMLKDMMFGEVGSRREYVTDTTSTLKDKVGSKFAGELAQYQLDTMIGPEVWSRAKTAGASADEIGRAIKMMGRQGQLQVEALLGSPEQVMNNVLEDTKDMTVEYADGATAPRFQSSSSALMSSSTTNLTMDLGSLDLDIENVDGKTGSSILDNHISNIVPKEEPQYSDVFIENTVTKLGVDPNYIKAQAKRNVLEKKQTVQSKASTDAKKLQIQAELTKVVGDSIKRVSKNDKALEHIKNTVDKSTLPEPIKNAIKTTSNADDAMLLLAQNNVTDITSSADTGEFAPDLIGALKDINTARVTAQDSTNNIREISKAERIEAVSSELTSITDPTEKANTATALVMQEDISSYVSELSQMDPDLKIKVDTSKSQAENEEWLRVNAQKIIDKQETPEKVNEAKATIDSLKTSLTEFYKTEGDAPSMQNLAQNYEKTMTDSAAKDIKKNFTKFSQLMRNKNAVETELGRAEKEYEEAYIKQSRGDATDQDVINATQKRNTLREAQKHIQTQLDTDEMQQTYSALQQQYGNETLNKNLYPQLESVALIEQAFEEKGETLKEDEALSLLYNIVGDPKQMNQEKMVDRVSSFVNSMHMDSRSGKEIKASIAKGTALAKKNNVDNSANVRSRIQQIGARSAAIGNKMGLSDADKDTMATQAMSISGLAANNASSRFMATNNRFVKELGDRLDETAITALPKELQGLARKLKNGDTKNLTKQDFENAQILAQKLGSSLGYSASQVNDVSDTVTTLSYYNDDIATAADRYMAERTSFNGNAIDANTLSAGMNIKNTDDYAVGRVNALFGNEMQTLLTDGSMDEGDKVAAFKSLKTEYIKKLQQEGENTLADKIELMTDDEWRTHVTKVAAANERNAANRGTTVAAQAGLAKTLDSETIKNRQAYDATLKDSQKKLGLTEKTGIAALADAVASPGGSVENGLLALFKTQSLDLIKTDGKIDEIKTKALAQTIILHQAQSEKDELYGADITQLESLANLDEKKDLPAALDKIGKVDDPKRIKIQDQLTKYKERRDENQEKIKESVEKIEDQKAKEKTAADAAVYSAEVVPVAEKVEEITSAEGAPAAAEASTAAAPTLQDITDAIDAAEASIAAATKNPDATATPEETVPTAVVDTLNATTPDTAKKEELKPGATAEETTSATTPETSTAASASPVPEIGPATPTTATESTAPTETTEDTKDEFDNPDYDPKNNPFSEFTKNKKQTAFSSEIASTTGNTVKKNAPIQSVTAISSATSKGGDEEAERMRGGPEQLVSLLISKLQSSILPVEVTNKVDTTLSGLSSQVGTA